MSYIPALKEFIVENFLFGDNSQLQDDTDFFDKGIVDSTGVLEIVSFIEETYDIEVDDEELVQENFSSLNALNNFLTNRLTAKES